MNQLLLLEGLEHSSSSNYEGDTEFATSTPSIRQSPSTLISQLGSEVSAFGFRDSDESPATQYTPWIFRTPYKVKPKRMRITIGGNPITVEPRVSGHLRPSAQRPDTRECPDMRDSKRTPIFW